jgi:hypothetical protein
MIVLYSLAIFLGAALLFLVQPLAAKRILPLLGGSPAVWNTCLVFYQATLLAGYAYAHALTRFKPKLQVGVHGVVLTLAMVLLLVNPLAPPESWTPPADGSPILWLLGLLGVMVAIPFFAVASASPLLQAWLARTDHKFADDPYFLYAASNAGSLLGLLAYPVLLEPRLTLDHQSLAWVIGFALYIPLALIAGVLMLARPATPAEAAAHETPDVPAAGDAEARRRPITALRRVKWIILGAIPSSLMVGVTHTITMDIAAVPFLWILPLALYLLTFIFAFSKLPMPPLSVLAVASMLVAFAAVSLLIPRPQVPLLVGGLGFVGTLLGSVILLPRDILGAFGLGDAVVAPIVVHLLLLFCVGLFCHRWLANDRPVSSQLTQFYLLLSFGGVLGGAFNALLAPYAFDWIAEYPIMIMAAGVAGVAWAVTAAFRSKAGRWASRGLVGAGALLVFTTCGLYMAGYQQADVIHIERTFFGVHKVMDNEKRNSHELQHGTTIHGAQWFDPGKRRFPLLYHNAANGCGRLFEALRLSNDPRVERVAITGLGVGALAAYAGEGHEYTIYEIDPAVDRIAENPDYFTYLDDARARGATVEVVLGDGRLRMEEAEDGSFGLIVLDAFSSDAVPVHLLTTEALRICRDKLQPGGIIAVNVTNRYLDLKPPVAATAAELGLKCFEHRGWPGVVDIIDQLPYGRDSLAANWIFLVADRADLLPMVRRGDVLKEWDDVDPSHRWTDDYSNLLRSIKWD